MKKIMYLILSFIFIFFCYYSYSLFQDVFIKKQDFSSIRSSIDDNSYVLGKDSFIIIRNNVNEKTKRNFSFSKKVNDGIGPYYF